jgi:hypothetical protein
VVEVPDDMSISQFHAHPVRQLIRHAAYTGEVPSRHELERLELSPSVRKKITDACRECAEIHATGEKANAWNRGDEHAVAIVGDLPEEQKDPEWFEGPREEDLIAGDPSALAARVPRLHGVGR